LGTGGIYEQLSLNFVPIYSGTAQIKFRNNDTGATSVALFSDFQIHT
jgi:hypothetical protein